MYEVQYILLACAPVHWFFYSRKYWPKPIRREIVLSHVLGVVGLLITLLMGGSIKSALYYETVAIAMTVPMMIRYLVGRRHLISRLELPH